MMKKSALLLGASGLVGSHLLQLLLKGEEYERIVILVRKHTSISHPKLEEYIVDFDRLEEIKDKFEVNDVFSCLGTTIKKARTREAMTRVDVEYPLLAARIAKEMGASQYLVVSSIGANPSSSFSYLRMKGILEQSLKEIGFQALHIFQPSLLLGERKEFRLGEQIGIILYSGLSFLFVGSLKKYKGIQASDVSLGMYKAAQRQTLGTYTYPSDQIYKSLHKHLPSNKKLG